jgi:hypothetical protein
MRGGEKGGSCGGRGVKRDQQELGPQWVQLASFLTCFEVSGKLQGNYLFGFSSKLSINEMYF